MPAQPTLAYVTFTRPFSLSAIGDEQPPGTYQVVTHEQPAQNREVGAHDPVATMFHLPARPPSGLSWIVQVDREELAMALAADMA